MTRARRTQQPPLNQDHLEEEKEPAPAVRQHVASVLDDVQASRRRDIKTQTKTRIQAEAQLYRAIISEKHAATQKIANTQQLVFQDGTALGQLAQHMFTVAKIEEFVAFVHYPHQQEVAFLISAVAENPRYHHNSFGKYLAATSPICQHVCFNVVQTQGSSVSELLVYAKVKQGYSFVSTDKLYEFIACSAALIAPLYSGVRRVILDEIKDGPRHQPFCVHDMATVSEENGLFCCTEDGSSILNSIGMLSSKDGALMRQYPDAVINGAFTQCMSCNVDAIFSTVITTCVDAYSIRTWASLCTDRNKFIKFLHYSPERTLDRITAMVVKDASLWNTTLFQLCAHLMGLQITPMLTDLVKLKVKELVLAEANVNWTQFVSSRAPQFQLQVRPRPSIRVDIYTRMRQMLTEHVRLAQIQGMTPDNMLAFFSTALKYANWVNHGLPELMSNDGAQILYSGTGGSGKTTLIKALTSFMTTTEWSLSQTTAFESQEAQQSNVLTCNEVGLYELSHNSFKIAADTKVLRQSNVKNQTIKLVPSAFIACATNIDFFDVQSLIGRLEGQQGSRKVRLASHDIEATLRRFEIILVKGIDADIPGIADRHKVDSIQRLTYSIMLTAFLLNGDYPKFATQYAHEFRDDVEIKFYRMLVREAYKSCDLATAIMLYDAHRTRYGKTTMSALIQALTTTSTQAIKHFAVSYTGTDSQTIRRQLSAELQASFDLRTMVVEDIYSYYCGMLHQWSKPVKEWALTQNIILPVPVPYQWNCALASDLGAVGERYQWDDKEPCKTPCAHFLTPKEYGVPDIVHEVNAKIASGFQTIFCKTQPCNGTHYSQFSHKELLETRMCQYMYVTSQPIGYNKGAFIRNIEQLTPIQQQEAALVSKGIPSYAPETQWKYLTKLEPYFGCATVPFPTRGYAPTFARLLQRNFFMAIIARCLSYYLMVVPIMGYELAHSQFKLRTTYLPGYPVKDVDAEIELEQGPVPDNEHSMFIEPPRITYKVSQIEFALQRLGLFAYGLKRQMCKDLRQLGPDYFNQFKVFRRGASQFLVTPCQSQINEPSSIDQKALNIYHPEQVASLALRGISAELREELSLGQVYFGISNGYSLQQIIEDPYTYHQSIPKCVPFIKKECYPELSPQVSDKLGGHEVDGDDSFVSGMSHGLLFDLGDRRSQSRQEDNDPMFEKKELEYECDEILAPQVQLDIAEAAVPRPELTESACINH